MLSNMGRHSKFIPLGPPTWRMILDFHVLLVLVAFRFFNLDTFGPRLDSLGPDYCPHLRRVEILELSLRHWAVPLHT